jgi:hypothetical protein
MEPLNLSPSPVPLDELIRRFNVGEYQLPAFQRPFVWRIRQTLNLLDSLIRGYPISVIYLWEPSSSSKLQPKKRTFTPTLGVPRVERFKAYIIDGQQRLTSLHAAFGEAESFDQASERSLECWLELDTEDERDGRITKLFQSPANKAFLTHTVAQQQPFRIRLAELFATPHQEMRSDREQKLRLAGFDTTRIKRATDRIDAAYRMLKTPITCITITQSDDEEVLQVFKRLNRGGTGLREGDVRAADLGIGKPVEVLQELRAFVEKPSANAIGFGFSFAFRALVVFHRGNAQYKYLSRAWTEEKGDRGQSLADSWKEAQIGLNKAIDVVSQLGWSRKPLLPSCNALIALAYSLHRVERDLKDQEHKDVLQWLCCSALRGVFTGSVETTLNKHLREIKSARAPIAGLLESLTKNERRGVKPEELLEPANLWGPASQVMFAWLISIDAKDWLTGQPLEKLLKFADQSVRPEETLSIQHIFPRKLLAEKGFNPEDANWPANFAIIGKAPNSSLKDLPPEDAIRRLETHEMRERARMQMFSSDAGDLLAPDRYEDFVQWRAKRIAETWNKWLELGA